MNGFGGRVREKEIGFRHQLQLVDHKLEVLAMEFGR
jgi:hypothetical protein